MKIDADENMPYVREAFSTLGDVVTRPGRTLSPNDVRDADLLLVRSITKVGARLLKGSKVRFVGTATIGEDHIDRAYLEEHGIVFSSAPGCNADSVAQYITAALLELGEAFGLRLDGLSLGVVGVGNVGSRVARVGAALGLQVVLCDPPLARKTRDAKYRALEEALGCDIVTLHVPLEKQGPDATAHLLSEAALSGLRPEAILLNTSRGAVVDNHALLAALEAKRLRAAVLDVWEGEPDIHVPLLDRVFIGTPHIAGYSFDGKVNGTRQVYEAACRFLGVAPGWDPTPLLPVPECPEVDVHGNASDVQAELRRAVRAVYDIRRDDAAMRALRATPAEERGRLFDRLRKEYPRRREFPHTRAKIAPGNETIAAALRGIGFTLE